MKARGLQIVWVHVLGGCVWISSIRNWGSVRHAHRQLCPSTQCRTYRSQGPGVPWCALGTPGTGRTAASSRLKQIQFCHYWNRNPASSRLKEKSNFVTAETNPTTLRLKQKSKFVTAETEIQIHHSWNRNPTSSRLKQKSNFVTAETEIQLRHGWNRNPTLPRLKQKSNFVTAETKIQLRHGWNKSIFVTAETKNPTS
jgi:hypothetical protein